ncbi:serine/threonine-protein kinase BSK1-2-like isoform X2 [Dioscorea cayenensis subsp. rotundata]|nr:serine/threonine-protein kinase BSK1-2-like isoform X2 [Dioscorea cayenensis subsp. rotundata]
MDVPRKNKIFTFGLLLRNLLSGNQISKKQEIEVRFGKKFPIILDSRLNGEYSAEEATALVGFAEQWMQYNPDNDRFTINDVIAALAKIQSNAA